MIREAGTGSAGRELGLEDRLVLLLVGASAEAGHAERLLRGPLDWSRVLAQARAHGVLSLVHRGVERLGAPGAPGWAQEAFRDASRRDAARNSVAARQLAEALRCLAGAGIPAIPLKGVALAERLYGSAAARTLSDLDVLVPRHQVAPALSALLACGYGHGEDTPVGEGEVALLLDSNMEYSLVPSVGRGLLRLELHWDIAWRWQGDTAALDDLWTESRPRACQGAAARAMSPEWELLYLAVHAARHRWGALKWLVDVHQIARRGEADWDRAADKARRFGWLEVLRITLGACRALLGTPVPPRLCPVALPGWLRLYPSAPGEPEPLADAVLPIWLLPGTAAKARYLGRLLLRPTLADRRLVALPGGLGFLYPPVRLARLGARWLRPRSRLGTA